MNGIKRILKNRNVVTALLLIVALVILYFGYTLSIKKETNPVSVPVAANAIPPLTQITAEDVTYKSIPSSALNESVLRTSNLVVGKYTTVNVTVPVGSMFYKEWVVDEKDVPGNWIEKLDYEKGELGYYMSVNVESTLGNSVLPDSYVDLYMKIVDENGTVMFGKLMENIKVLVVHDGNGKDVFRTSTDVGSPSKIGFAVSQDLYILLHKVEYLNVDLIIAPRGVTVPTNDYIVVRSATLRDYIDAQTITAPEDAVIVEETKEEEKKENNETPTEDVQQTNNQQAPVTTGQ